jgi:hypothetical protein
VHGWPSSSSSKQRQLQRSVRVALLSLLWACQWLLLLLLLLLLKGSLQSQMKTSAAAAMLAGIWELVLRIIMQQHLLSLQKMRVMELQVTVIQ